VTLEDFDRLPPRQKAQVNTQGYLRYLAWSQANADLVLALKARVGPGQVLVAD
jgi:hypothetical protein